MSDVVSRLSEREAAELCALADGSLPAERVAAVEARVAASAALTELVERQRRAVAATAALADDPPPTLRAPAPRGERPRARHLAAVVAVTVALSALAVAAIVALRGGSGGPSVAAAARLALQPASAPAPLPGQGTPATLAVAVDGVAFPDLAQAYGWRAAGVRRDEVDGRPATIVDYRKDARRLAYAIVSGDGLAPPAGAARTTRGGVEYRTLTVDGRPAVTWRRDGHTCVLIGEATPSELVTLASWPA